MRALENINDSPWNRGIRYGDDIKLYYFVHLRAWEYMCAGTYTTRLSTFFHFCPTSPYPEFPIMFIQSVFTTGQFDFPLPSPDRYILDVRESPVMESAARRYQTQSGSVWE